MTTYYPEPCQVPDAHGNPCGSIGACEHTPKIDAPWGRTWLTATESKGA